MRVRRGLGRVAVLVSLVSLVAAAGAQAKAPFAGKPRLDEVEAFCVTKGPDRGHVFVDLAVRYPDAPKASFARHEVSSRLKLFNARGELVATDTDRGRAQVDIPGLSSYVHTHQHRLGKAASKRALAGKSCGSGALTQMRVTVQMQQRLAGGAGDSGGASSSAAPATQSSGAAAAATVEGVPAAPDVENGCVYDSKGVMDCMGAFLQKASFVGIALPYANFSFANLLGANFSEARMGHVTMNKTVLDQADLSSAQLGSASLTSASLVGTNLAGALAPYANFAAAEFFGANLAGANLTGANLAETRFEGSNVCDQHSLFPGVFKFVCSNNVIVKG